MLVCCHVLIFRVMAPGVRHPAPRSDAPRNSFIRRPGRGSNAPSERPDARVVDVTAFSPDCLRPGKGSPAQVPGLNELRITRAD